MKQRALAMVLVLASCAPRAASPSDDLDRLARVVADARITAPLARAGCVLLNDPERRTTCEHDLDAVNEVLKKADTVLDNARLCREQQDEVCLTRTRDNATELLEKLRSFAALHNGAPGGTASSPPVSTSPPAPAVSPGSSAPVPPSSSAPSKSAP